MKDVFPILLVGVLFGAIVTVCILAVTGGDPSSIQNWKLSVTDVSTLIAGFGGTVVGGGIAWLIARQTASEVRERDHTERAVRDNLTLLQTTLKVGDLLSGFRSIHLPIEELAQNSDEPLWSLVRASVGSTRLPTFDAADLAPLAYAGEAPMINEISGLSNALRYLSEAHDSYSVQRLEYDAFAGPYTRVKPGESLVVASFPKEKVAEAIARTSALDLLIHDIKGRAADGTKRASKLAASFNAFASKQLKGTGMFIAIHDDS